jgi:hydrogenase maturation protease
MQSDQPKFLVLGLGNDLLGDDAVGLEVIRHLMRAAPTHPQLKLHETTEMGLVLLDLLVGCRVAVIVDSIQTGKVPPGTLHELDPDQLSCLTGRTPHFLGVAETLALGRLLGLPMPEQVRVLAVEVADPFTLGTSMTPAVRHAVPVVAERVAQVLRALGGPDIAQVTLANPTPATRPET